jgi:uncharacterized membrane protein
MSGPDDFWLRAPSAFFATLLVPLFYLAARRWFGPRAAFWATALLTFHPFAVVYAHELRMYSLVTVVALGSLYWWTEAVRDNKSRDWTLYAVCAVLGLYIHNWFVFLTVAQGGATLWMKRRNVSGSAVAAYAVVAFIYAPWIAHTYAQAARDQFSFLNAPFLYHLRVSAEAFTGTRLPSGHGFVEAAFPEKLALWSIFIWWAACAVRRLRGIGTTLVVGFLLPLGLGLLSTFTARPVYHGARYTIIALPALLLALTPQFDIKSFGQLNRVLVALCCALWLFPLRGFLTHFEKAPWKRTAIPLAVAIARGESVTLAELPESDRMVLRYYLPDARLYEDFNLPASQTIMWMPVRDYERPERLKDTPAGWDVARVLPEGQVAVIELTRR